MAEGPEEKPASREIPASHPVSLFKSENQEARKLIDSIREAVTVGREFLHGSDEETFFEFSLDPLDKHELPLTREGVRASLEQLTEVEVHYRRKKRLLYPCLKKHGLSDPAKTMPGKDNQIKGMLKKALVELKSVTDRQRFQKYLEKRLNPLLEEMERMIFIEDNILFPAALEKLSVNDWAEIGRKSERLGYAFRDEVQKREALLKETRAILREEPGFEDNAVLFPSGTLSLSELVSLLNTLPFDVTFVDREDKVRYFSEGKHRIFGRQRTAIGQRVQECHQVAESLPVVEKILASFKDGSRDSYEFWINQHGKFVHIRYFAARDKNGHYLGTLEVMQDITEIQKLKGERRLLDEKILTEDVGTDTG